jgi:hypothetical protein
MVLRTEIMPYFLIFVLLRALPIEFLAQSWLIRRIEPIRINLASQKSVDGVKQSHLMMTNVKWKQSYTIAMYRRVQPPGNHFTIRLD